MHSVILTELGIAVMEGGNVTGRFPFARRTKEYLDAKSGRAPLAALVASLSGGDVDAETNDAGVMAILRRNSIDTRMMDEGQADSVQDSKTALLVSAGFASNEGDALGKLRDFALELSSSKVASISETPDLHIIQAINSLDETDRMANGLFGRLREWYGLHFPELENLVDGMAGYCKVALAGRRDGLDADAFAEMGFPDSKADMLNLVAKTSRGGQISDENLKHVQAMAAQVLALHGARRELEEHVESQMRLAAPNLAAIAGAGVGARLLARAGSLQKLAVMAASTIQILGAEKALFRSMKTGSQPPKHGLIFQHAMVHRAPRWQRGKMARAVASKTAIAARMDAHEPSLNETLLEKLNVRVDEIGKKYPDPPLRPPAPARDEKPPPRRQKRRVRRQAKKPKRKRRFG